MDKVQTLVQKFFNSISAAFLRRETDLISQYTTVTWWCSTYHMLKQYVQLKQLVMKIEHGSSDLQLYDDEVDDIDALI